MDKLLHLLGHIVVHHVHHFLGLEVIERLLPLPVDDGGGEALLTQVRGEEVSIALRLHEDKSNLLQIPI